MKYCLEPRKRGLNDQLYIAKKVRPQICIDRNQIIETLMDQVLKGTKKEAVEK